jgi:hypothetical protein
MGPIRDAAQASQAMEACLLRQLIESSGVFKGSGAAGGQVRAQMFVEALADAVEKGGGVGLARLIEESLPATTQDDTGDLDIAPAKNLPAALNRYQERADLPGVRRLPAKGDWP